MEDHGPLQDGSTATLSIIYTKGQLRIYGKAATADASFRGLAHLYPPSSHDESYRRSQTSRTMIRFRLNLFGSLFTSMTLETPV